MKNFFLILLIYFLSQFSSFSDERDNKLNQLFIELKVNQSNDAFIVEQEIWKLWSTHPTDMKLTARLEEGAQFVRTQQLSKAIEIFTEVIKLDQNWAEAWNKRATVFYMMGNFKQSQEDIDKVLELEARHFGALAGQGLVNIQLKNYEKAILSYQQVKEIYPSMQSPEIMIRRIEELMKQQTI
ncbi:2-hydroxy-6-oxo-2,4-heptadienoate hydrolase [Candidatus Pelagibacter sp.]|nr:2-hydroxy-6-oxo-2,4-heptadienoate hydrolase [Candidatus Pelagibacter sp.]